MVSFAKTVVSSFEIILHLWNRAEKSQLLAAGDFDTVISSLSLIMTVNSGDSNVVYNLFTQIYTDSKHKEKFEHLDWLLISVSFSI